MEGKAGRRRSFVDVQRKSLLFDRMFDEENEFPSKVKNENLTMKQYLALLKEERMQWKDVLNARRRQLEEQQKKIPCETNEMTPCELEQFLDEEDKNFFKDEPDYLGMLECVDKYWKALDFIKRYKSDIIEHYKQIIEETEIENDELIENLCNENTCELCNQINCNNPDHK